MPVLILILVLFVLVLHLAARRSRAPSSLAPSTRRAWIVATLAIVASLAPVLLDAHLLAGPRSRLVSDASSHLSVAEDIASHGLPHGWIPTYNGGFPIGLHYPPVGWLLTAGLLRLGVHPVVAIKGLGLGALVAVPLLIFLASRLAGARAASAATGAIAIAWITPYIQFTGGWESFFVVGLLSQALVIPAVVLWVASLAMRSRVDPAPVVAALCAATHPQVFAVASVTIAGGVLATGRRELIARACRSILGGGLVALALYGPGVRTMTPPFGWPPDLGWRHVGFGPSRVLEWVVEGDLLDYRHGGAITAAWCASCVVHLLRPREPASRALLVSTLVTIVLAGSGPALARTGAFGAAVLSVFQPMRALAMMPVVATASIIGALDTIATWLAAIGEQLPPKAQRLSSLALPYTLVLVALAVVPPRASKLHNLALNLSRDLNPDACAPPIDGFAGDVVEHWLSVAPHGRIAFSTDSLHTCAATHGSELRRSEPMASSFGAGAHVGIHAVAFDSVASAAPTSAARAEALGVRTLIHTRAQRPGPPEAWQLVHRAGELEVSRRIGGTDYVGLGCIRHVLLGREKEIAAELFAMLDNHAARSTFLDDVRTLIELRPSDGPSRHEPIDAGECDETRATLRETAREPGAFEAEVDTSVDVDVVFRATAFSGWHVYDRGVELETRRVAPGFFSVRVGPGRHQLEAIVRLPSGYGVLIAAAILTVCALAVYGKTAALRARVGHPE